ncbi:MAG: helix-turn-helix transcriptional regulator [Bacillota bacterium]
MLWPLVGRDAELAELERLACDAAGGRGSLVLLAGEAGIGKTALVESLAQQNRGLFLAARGWCRGTVETAPYGPWLDLLRDLSGQTAKSLTALPEPFGRTAGGEGADGQAEALYGWLSALGRPVLLLLEDIHWADPASLELLSYIAPRLRQVPLLVVATCRSGGPRPGELLGRVLRDVQRAGAVRIDLSRLDLPAVRALTEAALPGSAAAAPLARRLFERTGGHAMFVRELLAAAVKAGAIPTDHDPLPETVQQAIQERLARLSPAGERAIAAAAVIGERFSYDLLARAAADPELDAGLEEALAQRILLPEGREGDRFAFDHALVREAVLVRLIGLRRRRLHQAVAEALLAGPAPDPESLAYHLSRAGDPRALDYLLAAVDRALSLGALAQAARLGEEALARMPEADPRRPELLLKQGVAVQLGDHDQARACWTEAAARGDAAVATWARHMLAIWHYWQHDPNTPALMAQVQAEEERLLDQPSYQALEMLLRRRRSAYPPIARLRAGALTLAGQLGEAQRVCEEIRHRLPPEQQHTALLDVEAGIAMYTGRAREAVELYRLASQEAQDQKNYRFSFLYKWNQLHAMLWAMADQPAEMDLVAAETERLEAEASQRSGYRWMPEGYSSLGFYQFVRGDWEAARHNLLGYLRAHPTVEDRTWWRYFAARMLLAMEEPAEAERVMAPVRPLSPEATLGFERISVMSHTMRARICLAQGRADLARPWLESASRHLAERQLRSMVPEVEVCWGLLHQSEGRNEAARVAAALSLEEALAQGDSWHAMEARRLLSALAPTPGQAIEHLGAALDLARLCRFPHEEALAQQALQALAAGSGEQTLPDGLTEREAEITRLVAQGFKDKEIGQRLFIAVKTVQAHLRNIFNKAGVSNRAALTAYAARHGLIQ